MTLGLALGALALFYFLFLPKPTPEEAGPALPVSTELRADGYQAAWRWLKSEGIPVVALHERYDRLLTGNLTRSRTGNILLTTLPHKLPARLGEVTQLDQWVEGGNTLIVMAALDDTPRWALMNNTNPVEATSRLTRLKFTVFEPEKQGKDQASHAPIGSLLRSLVQPQSSSIRPRGDHPLLEQVKAVQVLSEFPASRWRATPVDGSGVLQIGEITGKGDAAIFFAAAG